MFGYGQHRVMAKVPTKSGIQTVHGSEGFTEGSVVNNEKMWNIMYRQTGLGGYK